MNDGDDSFDDLDDGVPVGRRRGKKYSNRESERHDRLRPTLKNCPVSPRGKIGERFAFATPYGVISVMNHRDLTSPSGLIALFDGDDEWLRECFPAADKPAGFVAIAAGRWLMRECRAKGFFNPDFDLRGPGAWRLSDGALLLHLGDRVEVRRERRGSTAISIERFDAGSDYAGHYYYADRAEPAPAEEAATVDEVRELFDLLHCWRFADAEDPRMLLGWLGCAYLVGALKWRPHVWVTGDPATGKSTLEKLLRALLGAAALRMADTTKAAIAQRLNGAARPVLLDELERDIDPRRQKSIVELARLASTEGQGELSRGSPEGQVRSYAIRACFYMSSIVPAPLSPQDRSRIHVISLNNLGRSTTGQTRHVTETVERLSAALPARLRARAVNGFWRFKQNEIAYERAIGEVWSRGGRVVDQIGSLLAMADMLLKDEPTTLAQANAVLASLDHRRDEMLGHQDETEAQQCVEHLLTASIPLNHHSITLGELIVHVRKMSEPAPPPEGGSTARRACVVWDGMQHQELRRRGLAVAFIGQSDDLGLVIANQHRGLAALFEGSRWNGGSWGAVLRRYPGAYGSNGSMRFAGFRGRATIVPMVALPLDTEEIPVDTVEGPPPDRDEADEGAF